MFKMTAWNENINLDDFYKSSLSRGFINNSSKKQMIDCFANEKQFCSWVLTKHDNPIGFCAAHSFDIMEKNSFRICVRTCVFGEMWPDKSIKTVSNSIYQHQNFTSQFFIPQCILWAGKEKNLYITSNESEVGSQKLVHRIYFPHMEKNNNVIRIKDIFYRGTIQTVWKLNTDVFIEQYRKYRTYGIMEL
jgi:hypothetical protein